MLFPKLSGPGRLDNGLKQRFPSAVGQIVDNMCKLVEDPAEVLPLMPRLEPLVKNATEKISDPEARGVAEKAYKTLQKAAGEGAQSLQQAATALLHAV